jgi:hypothetical protein
MRLSLLFSPSFLFCPSRAFSQHLVLRALRTRQTALRSDEAGAKLANAQIEGGYWLAPLEDAANHWAVESARLQLTAYEAAQAAHGPDGRSSSPSAASRGARPMSKRTSTPDAPHPEKRDDPERRDVQEDVTWERDAGRLACGGAGAPPGRAGGRHANKEAPVVLPETIDTCVMYHDERRVRCF